MITTAMHDQSAATEGLRADVTARIQDDVGVALEAREDLRSSVEAIKKTLGQVIPTHLPPAGGQGPVTKFLVAALLPRKEVLLIGSSQWPQTMLTVTAAGPAGHFNGCCSMLSS